jgi:hypothetical protein
VRRKTTPALLLFLLGALAAEGKESRVQDYGLIVEVPDIRLDVESYQGGLGAKFGLRRLALRTFLDLELAPTAEAYAIGAGVALEKHFLPGPVSPYWGGVVQLGFSSLTTTIDSQNWDQDLIVPLRLGAILGVELFILEFLSIYVEYEAALVPTLTVSRSSVGGVVSSDSQLDISLQTGLGNQSMIGVVIYLARKSKVRPLVRGG